MSLIVPENCFYISKITGLGLMFALWIQSGEMTGFFLLLLLVLMTIFRWRFPHLKATIIIDGIVCIAIIGLWGYAYLALILTLFEGMYRSFYYVMFLGVAPFFFIGLHGLGSEYILLSVIATLSGFFLAKWQQEKEEKVAIRDQEAGKYYDVESIKEELPNMLTRLERMTALSERNRIAREIHDNAGHEIVAANISLQVVRDMLDGVVKGDGIDIRDKDNNEVEIVEAMELYDVALQRLDIGVNKIREAVHNMQSTTSIGVDSLLGICRDFPACPVDFKVFGDTSFIPVYIWSILESCLSESLTNVMRHARASVVLVTLDVTGHIVRLCIENDGVYKEDKPGKKGPGSGLRNLQHRTNAVGGSLSVDSRDMFRVVCVITLDEEMEQVKENMD